MSKQIPYHLRAAVALIGACALWPLSETTHGQSAKHDYPTHARVEYVNECIARTGGQLSNLYKCSCAIDLIAQKMTYDEFVEAATFARYATLPREAAGVFRDSERAKQMSALYRSLETDAYRVCGLSS